MKRREEIEKASVIYQIQKRPMAIGGDLFEDMVYMANINPSFVAGAEWADENPSREVIKTPTRSKEIVEAAKKHEQGEQFGDLVHSKESRGVISAYGIGFLDGAAWADVNPADGKQQLREMFEKASKCFNDNFAELFSLYKNGKPEDDIANEYRERLKKLMNDL